MAIIFNPLVKRIILDSTATSAVELYSRSCDWLSLSDNAKYGAIFRQVGGDDLGSDLYIPPYLFLQNGWRIRPMETNHTLVITGNVFVEEGGIPVVNTLGSYQINVNYTVPVQAQSFASGGSNLNQTDINNIVSSIWNFLKVGSGIPGSYGEHVKNLGGAGSNLVSAPATTITRVVGSDQGGTIANIQAHDDSYFSTGEVAGQGLAVVLTTVTNPSYIPNSFRLSGFYAGSGTHSVAIDVYNFILNIYETKGVMLNRSTPFTYTIPLEQDNIDLDGTIRVQLLHSSATYISSHRLYIDYVQFDLTNTYDSLSSDIAAIKNRTDQLSFTLGRINSNSQMISDDINTADLVESNILNIDLPMSSLDSKLDTIINTSNGLSIDITEVQSDIDYLNTTSSGTISTLNTINNNVQFLNTDIQTLGTDIQNIDSTIQNLNIPTVSDIVTAVWNHSKATQISSDVAFVKSIEGGKWEIKNNQMIFYAENNTTELARFNLYNDAGVLSEESVFKRVRV